MAKAATFERTRGEGRPPGSVVAGRFRVEALIGEGGMAAVYRATDLATSRPVALKILRADLCAIPEAASRFRREGELLLALVHPGIVRVETFGALEDDTLFLAMELLAGETLGAHMRRCGAMEPGDVAPLLAGVCAPLAAAHARGVVHRDLKPENIFLAGAPGDGAPTVKLLDFGISKVFGSERLTQTGQLLGTPRYMAPEQLAADQDLDARVDVYALGVILYEALAGQPPFLGATPSDLIVSILHGRFAPLRSVRGDLPPEVESVVVRAMARAREARYATPEELANAFTAAVGRASRPEPARARAGMATAVLGSMQAAPEALGVAGLSDRASVATLAQGPTFGATARTPAAAPSAPSPEELAPGTLSGFAAARVAPIAAPPRSVDAPLAGPRAGHEAASREAAPGPSAPWAPPSAPRGAGSASAASAVGAGHHAGVSGPARGFASPDQVEVDAIPGMRRAGPGLVRLAVLVVALLAGAASMIAVMAALGWLSAHRAPARPASVLSGHPASAPGLAPAPAFAPPAPAPPMPAKAPSGAAAPPASPSLPAPTQALPSLPAPSQPAPSQPAPPPPASAAASASADRAVPPRPPAGRPARASASPPEALPSAPAAEPPATPASLLAEARRAYARGEPEACSTLVERALAAGAPAITLKLQGDCFRRSGRIGDALAAYQRFCRLVPDNPAISEVTALAEGLGGTCP